MKSQGQRKIYITPSRLIRQLSLGEPTDVPIKCVIDGMDVGALFTKWAKNYGKTRTWTTAREFGEVMKAQAPNMFGNEEDWSKFKVMLNSRKAAREAQKKLALDNDKEATAAALKRAAA